MKETELEWLKRNRKRINLAEAARFIEMGRADLTLAISGEKDIPVKHLHRIRQYIKLFEMIEKSHPDIIKL